MMIDEQWHENITCRKCHFRHPTNLSCVDASLIADEQRSRAPIPVKWRDTPESTIAQLRKLWSEDALHMSGYHIASETLRLLGLPPNEEVQERQN